VHVPARVQREFRYFTERMFSHCRLNFTRFPVFYLFFPLSPSRI
jgi:hypothetical protein